MNSDSTALPSSSSVDDDEFRRLLGEYLQRIESDGTVALDAFRAKHPDFASRLGKHLDRLVAGFTRQKAEVPEMPERIGPYRVLHQLGRGGMGEVYLAEKTEPFRMLAAVKVIAAGQATASRVQRFAAEIQALALLNHDGIAKVFEAGTDQGKPFFAMEFVPGAPITDYCAEERLPVEARLRLFVRVCRAVAYAHRQGILHRDLKPSNILAHGSGDEATVKVIDFGLAKAIDEPAVGARATHSGDAVGTPDYMSPEQVDASPQRVVDTRADVYAIGVVLYELLTGCLPLDLQERRRRGDPELVRAIREEVPPAPSVRVARTTRAEGSPDEVPPAARRLCRQLVGDLDAIVMKAIAKDPDRRYGSADELAEDVLRHLRHEPVAARTRTAGYVLGRLVRRRRAAFAFAATLVVVGAVSLAWIAMLSIESRRHLERGNLFGMARYLEVLRDRDSVDPPPPRLEHVPALRTWLDEFDALLRQQDHMRLVAESSVEGADAQRPDLWTSGPNAELALRFVLKEAVSTMESMCLPGAERDKMVARIDWARRVADLTVEAHRDAWERVRREVQAEPVYGFDLPPQVGLVPLERDEATHLQLFWMPLPGGVKPERRNGRIAMEAATCPVFVLLPGAEDYLIGSQKDDSGQARFDEERGALEAGLHRVTIEPFFASVFEFTNGQWLLLDPGHHRRARDGDLNAPTHPLGNANGGWIQHVVHAWGMTLPTSEQWEYLARAGTDTPYWCGKNATDLEEHENLYDRKREASPHEVVEDFPVPWSDDFVHTSPVGSFPGNRFLLHDVLGNVCEVAVFEHPEGAFFELRGSSYHEGSRDARATARMEWDGAPRPSIGFRPVIAVDR